MYGELEILRGDEPARNSLVKGRDRYLGPAKLESDPADKTCGV
jgi:hypothetical protein